MSDINVVVLTGRLVRDVEIRNTSSGTPVASGSIASDDGFGEREHTSFFDFTLWGKAAEGLARYMTKGRDVTISGRLRQDRWRAQDGGNRSKVVVNIERVKFNGRREEAVEGTAEGGSW